ncbi:membrane-bound PQQ-dependent dehydrogenase, glucose/quinate/shikimate family [Brevundimonas sp.]|uniref:membrane-bound PQQ-dependent dehydrogenase, glucose/quinate/shikimate family n=1 Tax=Brevundimonas sp. TaxID=1871086 RepID=UPI0025C59CF5|nr:membrane-bound PQQ-dependent dehydrogenase, glucose/quinate/shikimate family [Brevundimonas sp.]
MQQHLTPGSAWIRRAYAALLIAIGVFLAGGGGWLVGLGGSPYYLLTGLAVIASGMLLWRGDRRGVWVYAAMLIATIGWSLWEVGFNPWGLVPRLVAPTVLGLGLLVPAIGRLPSRANTAALRRRWASPKLVALGGLVAAIVLGSGLHALKPPVIDPIFQAGTQERLPQAIPASAGDASGDWLHWGGDQGGSRFSPLDQLTPDTVSGLKVAWTADLGPAPGGKMGSLEVTPLKIGDTLYVCTPYDTVIALDAETGQRRWTHSEQAADGAASPGVCRGVAYYRLPDPAATGACVERILWVSRKANLLALDARTGALCPGFGDDGRTSLMTGLGEVKPGYYYVSSAPQIVRGKIVLGGAVMDGQYWGEPSGVIRGYDAVTGRFSWAYDVGRPGEHGEPEPGEHYTLSTPNSWAPISADEQLGMVYLPMGNAVPDYYGAQRRPFDEDITSSVLALDAQTGERRWRFRTVHHDLWDYDLGSQPTLIDLPLNGQVVPVLIQPTKRGDVFVLDRRTGQPVREVRELPVPQGPIAPGERLSPTQPFSVAMPSFRGPLITEADMWGVTPLDQMMCRIKFKQARYEGLFTPPQIERPNLVSPGYLGGSDWGSVSVDTDRMVMIVNSNRMPNYDQLITRAEANQRGVGIVGVDPHANPALAQAMLNTPVAADIQPFLGVLKTPCNAPPWGLITAVDLRSGKVIWNRPLGTARDSGPMGIASQLPITMGLPNVGGSVVTRGGLVFIAAVQERTFRAIDIRNGQEVWSARLPAGGQANPMTYRSNASGRQFVVLASGGHVPMGTKLGTSLIAYALPENGE